MAPHPESPESWQGFLDISFSFISFQGGVDSKPCRLRQRECSWRLPARAQHHVVTEAAGGLAALRFVSTGGAAQTGHGIGADDRIDAHSGLHADSEPRLHQAKIVFGVRWLFRIERTAYLAFILRT